jgi:uncharacterized protein (TIGR02452 family)
MAVVRDAVVFRDEKWQLLRKPLVVCFLAACAGARGTLKRRIERILDIAVWMRATAVALGAFGCRRYGNDPAVVAGLFKDALITSKRKSPFSRVVFAIVPSREANTEDPFTVFQRTFQ